MREPKNSVTEKLLAPGFSRSGSDAPVLTDPIADTPMIVSLDQLRPYENDPRVTRNPRFAEIKASILSRGLDAPPPITRRPGDEHYVIRNGGNTRLAVLRELWSETRQEKFFRIPCLFRPWTPRGEIVLLTGHLAENEFHGNYIFIERAIGIEKARELYELEQGGKPLTQAELAKRLTEDGYPISQPKISRMQDAVKHLLPVIPNLLYAGLGRPQVERLTILRRAAARVYERHTKEGRNPSGFSDLFREALGQFNDAGPEFDVHRLQDELIGQLSQALGLDYDAVVLELLDAETRHNALSREPTFHVKQVAAEPVAEKPQDNLQPAQTPTASPSMTPSVHRSQSPASPRAQRPAISSQSARSGSSASGRSPAREADRSTPEVTDRVRGHIVSAAETTDRLQAIQRMVASASGQDVEDFHENAVRAIPVQAGGLHPISDVWYIEPTLDSSGRLRVHIAQLAREIAAEADAADCIEPTEDGLGFACVPAAPSTTKGERPMSYRAVVTLLASLSSRYQVNSVRAIPDDVRVGEYLSPLLLGVPQSIGGRLAGLHLSDTAIVKLFRFIRLARRLVELQNPVASPSTARGPLKPGGSQ